MNNNILPKVLLENRDMIDVTNDIIAMYLWSHLETSHVMHIDIDELCTDIINAVWNMTSKPLLTQFNINGNDILQIYTLCPKFSSDKELLEIVLQWWKTITQTYSFEYTLAHPESLTDFSGNNLIDQLFYYVPWYDESDDDEIKEAMDCVEFIVTALNLSKENIRVIKNKSNDDIVSFCIHPDHFSQDEYDKIIFQFYYGYIIMKLLQSEAVMYAHHEYIHTKQAYHKRKFSEASFQLSVSWHIQNTVNILIRRVFPKLLNPTNDDKFVAEIKVVSEIEFDEPFDLESFTIYPMIKGLKLINCNE